MGVRFDHYRELFNSELQKDFGDQVRDLHQKGLVGMSGDNIFLTSRGLLLADTVCSEFIMG